MIDRLIRALVLVAALCTGLASCAPTRRGGPDGAPVSTRANASAWQGCYAVEIEEWRPALLPPNLPYHTPPATIVIDTALIVTGPDKGMRSLRPLLSVRFGPIEPGAYWEPLQGDSARLVWTGRFAGSVLRMARTENGFAGVAQAFSDVVTSAPPPRARVTGTAQPCNIR